MTTDKPEDKPEDKLAVKFTDYPINKYQVNFDKVKGKSVGVKIENSGLMGLKLFWYK
mgnify:CR=1 FL=1